MEPSCNMAVLACLTHHWTWRWPSGRGKECSVLNPSPQDQCPLQYGGTIHKANWCRGIPTMWWIKLVLLVVGVQHSTSKATNEAKVESTSAKLILQGTTRKTCLLSLVSDTTCLTADEWYFPKRHYNTGLTTSRSYYAINYWWSGPNNTDN